MINNIIWVKTQQIKHFGCMQTTNREVTDILTTITTDTASPITIQESVRCKAHRFSDLRFSVQTLFRTRVHRLYSALVGARVFGPQSNESGDEAETVFKTGECKSCRLNFCKRPLLTLQEMVCGRPLKAESFYLSTGEKSQRKGEQKRFTQK